MIKKTLVIGLGNSLSGDDGFGPLVVERFRRECPGELAGCDIVDSQTDLLACFDSFQHYEKVVLVDALLDPEHGLASAGKVIVLHENDVETFSVSSPGVHSVSPLLALRLYRRLHGGCRPIFCLILLCTDRIEMGRPTHLTEPALSEACRIIRQLLAPKRCPETRGSEAVPSGDGL